VFAGRVALVFAEGGGAVIPGAARSHRRWTAGLWMGFIVGDISEREGWRVAHSIQRASFSDTSLRRSGLKR